MSALLNSHETEELLKRLTTPQGESVDPHTCVAELTELLEKTGWSFQEIVEESNWNYKPKTNTIIFTHPVFDEDGIECEEWAVDVVRPVDFLAIAMVTEELPLIAKPCLWLFMQMKGIKLWEIEERNMEEFQDLPGQLLKNLVPKTAKNLQNSIESCPDGWDYFGMRNAIFDVLGPKNFLK